MVRDVHGCISHSTAGGIIPQKGCFVKIFCGFLGLKGGILGLCSVFEEIFVDKCGE